MTTTTKRDNLEAIFLSYGFTRDRWGFLRSGDYKIDCRRINIKIYQKKFKIWSKPMGQQSIEHMINWLEALKKKGKI